MGRIIMTQEDKKLVLKDLSARLPYGVKIAKRQYNYCNSLTLTGIVGDRCYFNDNPRYDGDCPIDEIKPYLLPISSMTEEEQRTLDSMCNGVEMVSRLSGLKMFDKAFNWLDENHFDYRGLIEKGLAIDATGKNIY